jgi:hypothetical protein
MSAQPDQRQPLVMISVAVAIAGLAVVGVVFALAWVLTA